MCIVYISGWLPDLSSSVLVLLNTMRVIVILLVVVLGLTSLSRAASLPTEEDQLQFQLEDVGLLINDKDFELVCKRKQMQLFSS